MKIDHPAVPYALRTLERGDTQRTRVGTRTVYRIVMCGELSPRYAAAFEGMNMEARNGCTILTGEVIDQPHLHGILDHIGALGLEILSVESFSDEPYDNEARIVG
ncbi:MAG TPA: hypothetical protein VHM69_05955 [Rubrobacter sp.]|nr:hypothetical protein [Rubrobacter sp.]